MSRQFQQPNSTITTKHIARFFILLLIAAFLGLIVGGMAYFVTMWLLTRSYSAPNTTLMICGIIGIVTFLVAMVFVVYHGLSVIRYDEDVTSWEDSDKST